VNEIEIEWEAVAPGVDPEALFVARDEQKQVGRVSGYDLRVMKVQTRRITSIWGWYASDGWKKPLGNGSARDPEAAKAAAVKALRLAAGA